MSSVIQPAKFTVQGGDTPVPAYGSEQAGGNTSSSCNCKKAADHLAPKDASDVLKKEQDWDRHEKLIADLLNQVMQKRTVTEKTRDLIRSIQSSARRLRAMQKSTESGTMDTTLEMRTVRPRPASALTVAAARIRGGSTTTLDSDDDSVFSERSETTAKRRMRESPEGNGDNRVRKRPTIKVVPPETPARKQDEVDPAHGAWEKVERRGKMAKAKTLGRKDPRVINPTGRRPRIRPSALIIRPVDKTRYADILRRVTKEGSACAAGACVDKIRRTATGDMLILVEKGKEAQGHDLQKVLSNVLGDEATVLDKGPQEDLEIRDIVEFAEKEDILEALKTAVGGDGSEITITAIKSLRKAFRGTQTASVSLPASIARQIQSQGSKIRILCVNCKIVPIVRPLKCFKCWQFGHLAMNCKSTTDRTTQCFRCGGSQHKVAECKEPPKCALCTDADPTKNCAHVAGSSRCPIYQDALQKART